MLGNVCIINDCQDLEKAIMEPRSNELTKRALCLANSFYF